MASKKTHVEVSLEEQIQILKGYTLNPCNWSIILQMVKENAFLLPANAAKLYREEEYAKLKRRMSDQVRKVTKEDFKTNSVELSNLITEVKLKESRYSGRKGSHPLDRKEVHLGKQVCIYLNLSNSLKLR